VDITAFATEQGTEESAIAETQQTEETGEENEGMTSDASEIQSEGSTEKSTEEHSEKMTESEAETETVKTSENVTETETQTQEKTEMETTETSVCETSESDVRETETEGEDLQETVTKSETETEAETEFIELNADGNIASGVVDEEYGHITWVIDKDGKLTVEGTGDFAEPSRSGWDRAPWRNSSFIKSAEINVTGMTDASGMFEQCINMTNVDLSGFDTSKVVSMRSMFYRCYKLESLDLSKFITNNVTLMDRMFTQCEDLKSLNLSGFDTSKVTDMRGMFSGCNSLMSLSISNFDTSKVTSMRAMFGGCSSLPSLDLSNFDTIQVTDMSSMFSGCNSLTSLNLNSFDTSHVTGIHYSMSYMFQDCSSLLSLDLSSFNTSQVMDMEWMFSGCSSLTSLDLSSFDTNKVTGMANMFYGCSSLTSLNLSGFNTSQVTEMWEMFGKCSKLQTLNLNNFDTSEVITMNGMFEDCSSLRELNVKSFDTSKVTDMSNMFYECRNLTNLDLCNFNTRNVTKMKWMFLGCNNLSELKLSNFDTSKVTDMNNMFWSCSKLAEVDLSNFDASKVTDMDDMFGGCYELKTIQTPKNICQSIELPRNSADTWYRSDGSTVTELPQNLSYSVVLGKNYIPEEKGEETDIDVEDSIFQFRDELTGALITGGRVRIDETYSTTDMHYYKNTNGSIIVPISKNCKRIFMSTYFEGYEYLGGWIEISYYRSESGVYIFMLKPKNSKYTPNLPSIDASVNTSGPNVPTSDGDISIFNMKMDFELNFGKGLTFKRTYDKNSRTVKVSFSTDGKQSYDTIKKEYKSSGYKSGKTLDEEFDKTDEKLQPGTLSNIDVKVSVKGYLECDESGKLVEGGMIVAVKGSGSNEYRPACTAGVAYAKFELGVTTEGTLKFTRVDNNIDTSGAIKIEPYASIAAGIGWKLAHAEVGATGKFSIKFTIPFKNANESLNIDGAFEIYGETVLFCFGDKVTAEFKNNIWPGARLASYATLNDINARNLQILPRDYISSNNNSVYSFDKQSTSGFTSSDSFRYSEISSDKGVFKENNVQYVRLSDGTELLAWVHDFGDKSAVNRTTLVYSVNTNDGNGWSSITPVCSDTTMGDYYPSMVSEGTKAYLVWNKASKKFDDNVSVADVCRYMDVYVSVFEDGEFSEPQLLSDTNNTLMEFSPLLAVDDENVSVAWLTNSENDYHYTKGSNSIYICEYKHGVWSSPVCCAQNLNYVSDYDIGYVDGKVVVLYAEDADNVSDTLDGTIYYIKDGIKTEVGNSSYHAGTVEICDKTIYFSGDNKIYKLSCDNLSNIYNTGIATDNFRVVKSTSGSEAILFLRQDEFARNVYVSYYKNGVYASPVPVISDNSKVTNYSPIYNDDGTISIAYNEEEVLSEADYVYGLTDMVVRRDKKTNTFFVDSDLSYNAYDVAPGNTIEFGAKVYNYTTESISNMKVTLTGSSSGEVYAGTQNVDVPVGEARYIRIPYTLPDNIINQQYTLTVMPVNADGIDLPNNDAVCELGYSDIAISEWKIENNTITGTITNNGYQTAKNISLAIREDNQNNNPIAEIICEKGDLSVGESWSFSQKVESTEFKNVGDIKYYLISATTASAENNYGNNSVTIYSAPIMATGITLDIDTLSLTQNTSASLNAEVSPEIATFKDAIFTSDNNNVVVVDNDGNVYALEEGRTVVTAYTLDGSHSAICEITVEGTKEKKYTLSDRSLELEVGDNSSLCVKNENGENAENIVWSSTNEDIVTIASDGSIVAVGEGTALLIAQIGNFVDVCTVRVMDYAINGLFCEEDFLQLATGETFQLQMVVVPENTTMDKTLTYVVEDESVANVSDLGLITAIAQGGTVVTVSSVNGVKKKIIVNVNSSITCTVQFDTQGGNDISPITSIEQGSTVNLPTNVTKAGYTFDGWYTQPIGGDKVSGTITVTESITLYAHWIEGEQPEEPTTEPPTESETEPTTDPSDTENQGDGLWISGVSKSGYQYTGEAVKPSVKVYDKTTLLTEKTDYTISYKNNTKVGKATITVTGKGNYSGKEIVPFNILPADIGSEEVHAMDFYVKIGKKAQKPIPELYYMGIKLKNNKDFTISYSNASNIYTQTGEYSVIVTGKGNYTGTRDLKLMAVEKVVKPKPISIAKAALSRFNKSFTYTGKACKQECTLTVQTSEGGKILVEGMDYTVQYANNVKAGTATVTYYGRNGYTGKLKKTYKIVAYDILNDPNAKIKYENNFECIYAKGGSKPKPVVTFEGKVLKEGVDYTLSYKNNKAVYGNQTPCVTVIGKGNFKGKIPINFTIKAQDLSKMTLVSGDKVYKNKANIYKITPKLMDLDGKLLSAGKDFDRKSITYVYENDVVLENGISKEAGSEVEKTDIIPADTQIRITLNCGSGSNYTGAFTGTYRIVKADIKSAKVTIPKQIYTGNEIILDKSQITVKLSGITLKPEDYEIIQYADNVKKGKASVTIKGKGNYGGVKTVKFTIGAKGFLWWWRK